MRIQIEFNSTEPNGVIIYEGQRAGTVATSHDIFVKTSQDLPVPIVRLEGNDSLLIALRQLDPHASRYGVLTTMERRQQARAAAADTNAKLKCVTPFAAVLLLPVLLFPDFFFAKRTDEYELWKGWKKMSKADKDKANKIQFICGDLGR